MKRRIRLEGGKRCFFTLGCILTLTVLHALLPHVLSGYVNFLALQGHRSILSMSSQIP